MATSGAFGTNNPYVKYTIDIRQNSQNVTANTSNVTVSVRFYRTNTGYKTWGSGTIWCKINGTTYSAGIVPSQEITNAGIVLFTKTLDIPHNADGTKNLSVSAWINMNSPLTSNEQGFSQNLTTIPRATTPVLTPTTQSIGGEINILLPRAANTFTHNVRYVFGNLSGNIASFVGTETSFTIPQNFASQFPDSSSGFGDIVVDTYNNGVFIGTARSRFTVTIANNFEPIIDSVTFVDSDSKIAAKFGAFVSTKSKMNIRVSARGTQGSQIAAVTIQYGDKKYNGFSANNVEVIAAVKGFSVTVRDTRGQSITKIYRISVLEYTPPQIHDFKCERCDSSGKEDDNGSSLLFNAKFNIASCNNCNDKNYKIEYKKTNEETWNILETGNIYTFDQTKADLRDLFDVDYSYQLKITVTDYFGSVSTETQLPTAFTLVDFYNNGRGISFGRVAKKEGYVVEMPADFSEDVVFGKKISFTDADKKPYSIFSLIYPIGIIVAFANDTDPNAIFEGTQWEKTAIGSMLVGYSEKDEEFNKIGKTGGEKEHYLSNKEIPSHSHAIGADNWNVHGFSWGDRQGGDVYAPVAAISGNVPGGNNYLTTKQGKWNVTGLSGSGNPHNNLPPYQVVVYWMRTA